jgi:chromosome segregation ATPase
MWLTFSAGLPMQGKCCQTAYFQHKSVAFFMQPAHPHFAVLLVTLTKCRKEQSDLVQQRDQLALQLSITKRDKATQVANLRAENASLRAELQGAAATIEAHTLRLRTLEQQAAEQQASADAAAAGGREEVASLRARVQQVEAHCTQQAGQLSKVPALQQQLQACKAALEHQRNEAEAAEQVGWAC